MFVFMNLYYNVLFKINFKLFLGLYIRIILFFNQKDFLKK